MNSFLIPELSTFFPLPFSFNPPRFASKVPWQFKTCATAVLTRRSSGLGGLAPMKVEWFLWFVLSVGQQSFVEAPKPLNAGVSARGVSRALLIECKSLWRKA